MGCRCGGSTHDACDPRWPENLSDDQLLRTHDTTLTHHVTKQFNAAIVDEMKKRGLSSRHWLPLDEDDDD